MFLNPPIKRS